MVTSVYVERYCLNCDKDTQVHVETSRCQTCGRSVPTGPATQPRGFNGLAQAPQSAPVQVLLLPDLAATRRWVAETERYVAMLTEQATRARERLEQAQRSSTGIDKTLTALRGLLKQVQLPTVPAPTASGQRWAREYDACIDCGTTTIRHASSGRCKACDSRHRRTAA